MIYMGDSNWWNERFKARGLNIMHHEKLLEEDIKYFPSKGKILDIACGDGRNSIYLARLGYSVQAIDFSKEALNRLNHFLKRENIDVQTRLVDLASDNAFVNLDKYDVIIINHYRVNPKLYKSLMACLNADGVLWINGFREIPKDNINITELDVLSEEDFVSLHDYRLKHKSLYELEQRKFIRCMWKK